MAAPAEQVRQGMLELLPRLRRFARALAGQAADADDLVQTTIERALRAADQWRPGTRLDSWMFRIMKNCWIDQARANASRARVLAPEEAGEHAATDGEAAIQAHLEARAVQRAMAALPDEQRIAVALVLVDGLAYKEAAEVLDIPIGTLTSRLARGRAAIEAATQGGAS
jgi:RNA polymerase sigma-70 factor (ECF subfamily)